MIYLPHPSIETLDEFQKIILPKVKSRLEKAKRHNRHLKDYFEDEKIKEILLSKPRELEKLSVTIYDLFRSKTSLKSLGEIFDYKSIISESQSTSYKIASLMNRNTCTYCNRNYTLTVIKNRHKKKHNNSDRIARPQFDHWFPQSKYPILALSYFNLIPSCSMCNTTLKGTIEFNTKDYVHPYIDEKETYSFDFFYDSTNELKVTVEVVKDSKMDKTLKVFEIEEIYNAHSNLELKDLIDLRQKYSTNYIESITDIFKNEHIGKDDILRMVFGIESNIDNYHKRTMNKFKIDILKVLGVEI